MTGPKDPLAIAVGRRRIQVQRHQLIHVPPDEHVAIQQDNAIIIRQ